jgi:phosphatidylglycerophosphate synthase
VRHAAWLFILMPYFARDNVRPVAPAIVGGLVAIGVLAWLPPVAAGLGPGWGVQASLVFLLVMAVPLVCRTDGTLVRLGAANAVTAVRVVIVAAVAGCVGRDVSALGLWGIEALVAVFAILDGVDGWLARARGETTAFGARFDMETDAAFILVLSLLVWRYQGAGRWVLLCGLMRYAFVAAGWMWPWLAAPLRPTRRGRVVAVVQFVGLALALVPSFTHTVCALAAGVALALLTWSFALDVSRLARARHAPLSAWR